MPPRKAARLHENLKGGLPFPTLDGRPTRPRPLEVRTTALSAKQSEKEDDHLISCFVWFKQWEREYPQLSGRLCFHTENERLLDEEKAVTRTNRSGQQYRINLAGVRRQQKGVKRGVVDVLNLRPARGYPYFAGELKVRREKPTDDQAEFILQARTVGAFAHVYWCWSELARAVMWYFDIRDRRVWFSAGDPRDFLIPSLGGHDGRCDCQINQQAIIRSWAEQYVLN